MKTTKQLLVATIIAMTCLTANAGFGGSRGGFSSSRSFSSSSFSRGSSSFGGLRSTYNAPIVRPTTTYRPYSSPAPTTTNVYHNSSYGSSNGLLTGMMIGHMMSGPNTTVVQAAPAIVAPAQVVDNGPYSQPAYSQQSESSGFGKAIAWILFLSIGGFIAWCVYRMYKRETIY